MKPKFSRKQIAKAGEYLLGPDAVRKDSEKFSESMDILSYWRFSHADALEKAFACLQRETLKRDRTAIFAKRLKRHISIVRKLQRFETMKLSRIQDIGGCRAVLSNNKKLQQLLRELKKQPEFKGIDGKIKYKDYIKKPKDDGYRSYHLIGRFSDSNGEKKSIEIQLRTRIQHYWATAVEIVDLFTDQALKSNQGDEVWKTFFTHVGVQFAVLDDIHLFDTMEATKQYERYIEALTGNDALIHSCRIAQEHCNELDVFERFNGFAGSLKVIDDKLSTDSDQPGYVLLKIDTSEHKVYSEFFSDGDSSIAEEKYIEAEKEAYGKSKIAVALVSTSAVGDIKEAYPNYFADSTKFMGHLEHIANANITPPASHYNA